MGHVLLPADIPAKQQFLLALLARLAPEGRGELASAYLDRAGAIAGLDGPESVVAFIDANASRLPAERRTVALEHVAKARERIAQGRQAAEAGEHDAAFAAAREAIGRLREGLLEGLPSQDDEFRGVWCHSAFGVDGWTWDEALAHLKAQGFTAVVPNMLWSGLAYYPSEYLPVADSVADRGDQIAACLAAAERHGIDVHVWKVNWGLQNAPAAFIEELRAAGRLQRHRDGSELEWLCPSHPANFELEKNSLLEVVRNYAVDGIHFDYIRYPHGSACYDDGCRERFQEATGRKIVTWPDDVIDGEHADAFGDWRREQITRLVRAVSAEARELRPGVEISAAVFRDYPNCRRSVGQDWVDWVAEGYLDFVCPMNYTDDEEQFATWVASQREYVGDRVPLYPGVGASAPGLLPEQTAMQVHRARELGSAGFIVFNYDRTVAEEHLPALRLGATADGGETSGRETPE
ncbi:family 10 glycosylhydrolase [Candidatus Poribacteria bacterium]|nr:family 10 glycosylhydrolase [Candidatus Poribacteria bacterium]